MNYDVLVIGGGLSGLTTASLLAKRGLRVGVVEKSYNPGGSCGVFKRGDDLYDIGASMMFGFGEKGFNAHRFVFNSLEESIDVIKHEVLYCMNFKGHRIQFYADIDQFAHELAEVFPTQEKNILRFYHDMEKLYKHVMVENPNYSTPDETKPVDGLKAIAKHPLSYFRFLTYLNRSAKSLLEKYFDDEEIFKFFDKLTSTYCYTTVAESPAILATVMFVDNHYGGSYYPCGSTLFVPGKLEKVIEENGGTMLLGKEVVRILFNHQDRPYGVLLNDGTSLFADYIVYSGTVWNLYNKLIEQGHLCPEEIAWANRQVPTYPSVVIYTKVDKKVIPEGTRPIEMLVGNPDYLDESEVTAYIPSLADPSVCDADSHLVMAIGPSFEKWSDEDSNLYVQMKEKEKQRLLQVLEKRFPGLIQGLKHCEIASPITIERYTNKNKGAVAGPKQMLGQHLFKRQKIQTRWPSLICCGESTTLGTGTTTVTTSGISAANAVLRKMKKPEYVYDKLQKNYVHVHQQAVDKKDLFKSYSPAQQTIISQASQCRYCEHPTCSQNPNYDVRGLMRRLSVGNFAGAKNVVHQMRNQADFGPSILDKMESFCIRKLKKEKPVSIREIVTYMLEQE